MYPQSIQLLLPEEEWRPVPGYEGIYEISRTGLVRRIPGPHAPAGHILKPPIVRGYPHVTLYKASIPHQYMLHRLVALTFLGLPPAPLLQVNHIDGVKTNNRVENLEWVTASENRLHAYRIGLQRGHGRGLKGEANPRAKLTWADVREIRRLRNQVFQHELAKRFGVAQSIIARIQIGKIWQSMLS